MREFGILKGPDLIQLLSTLLAEGTLGVKGKIHILKARQSEMGHLCQLVLGENHILQASSSDFKFRLGQTLVKKGLITKDQMEQVLAEQKLQTERQPTGQMLLEKGLLDADVFIDVVNHLSEMLAYEVIMWKETEFTMETKDTPDQSLDQYIGANVPVENLLNLKEFTQDADKNLPILMLMKDMFSNPNTLLKRAQDNDHPAISDQQMNIYHYVNSRNSFRDILILSDYNYFETFSALYQLVSWGIVKMGELDTPGFARKVATSPPPPPTPSGPKIHPRVSAIAQASASSIRSAVAPTLSNLQRNASREFLKRSPGAELLQVLVSLLKNGRKTGTLIIENPKTDIRNELTLYNGNLVHASSTMYRDRFGDLLVRKGLISPDDLQAALDEQKSLPNKRLGQVLVEKNLIVESVIPETIFHQIECVLYEALSWAEAKFYFLDSVENLQEDYVIYADYEIVDGRLISRNKERDGAQDLLVDADKNLPILLMIKETIPHPAAIVQRREYNSDFILSDEQVKIVNMVDGINSINDIVVMSDLDYFQSYAILFQLVSAGVVEVLTVQTLSKSDDTNEAHESDTAPTMTEAAPAPKRTYTPTATAAPRKPSVIPPRPATSPPTAPPTETVASPVLPSAPDQEAKLAQLQETLEAQRKELFLMKQRFQSFQKLENLLGEELINKLVMIPSHKFDRIQTILLNIADLVNLP